MRTIPLSEASHHLDELVDEAIKGKEIVIERDKSSRVKLVPVHAPEHFPVFGSAKDKIFISEDFDSPIPDFNVYER
ncbi:MAG: type II toxin-antitoxin system prevent-host-death family antitoxin [Chitinivibrionales bacterium]|nr:type II toxin-antitoxin system prevent-host-death family antitoxin [Chitinivibrionales bacterium]